MGAPEYERTEKRRIEVVVPKRLYQQMLEAKGDQSIADYVRALIERDVEPMPAAHFPSYER
jgi:hypothetical protein